MSELNVSTILAEALKHRGEYPAHDRIEPERFRLAADIQRALYDAGYTVTRAATEPGPDLREYLAANLFDGDEDGTLTTSIATFLGEVVDVVNEWLATPTSSPRPTSEETSGV